MDNDKAIEKLADIMHAGNHIGENQQPETIEEIASTCLAAIQADPLAYVKPKPLVWEACDQLTARWISSSGSHTYRIEEYDLDDFHVWDNQNGWDCFSHRSPTLEAAQAAAFEHLCDAVKELF